MLVQQNQRIANIEYLRILAAFGITWFHTQNAIGRSIGYIGLPVFLIIFSSLSARNLDSESLLWYARRKAHRLLKPWLFWSIIYIGYKVLKQSILHTEISESFSYSMLLTGSSLHLWYLPFAFVMAIVINLLQRCTMNISSLVTIVIMAIFGIVFLSLSSIVLFSISLPIPLPQWIFGLPSIPLGFAVGKINSSIPGRLQKFLYFIIILTTCATGISLYCFGYRFVIMQYILGLILVCIAFIWNGKWNPFLEKCASLTFGIYLIHPLINSILSYLVKSALNTWLMLILVFLISSLVTMFLQKTPLRKFI